MAETLPSGEKIAKRIYNLNHFEEGKNATAV